MKVQTGSGLRLRIDKPTGLRVRVLEVIDRTPIFDLKAVIAESMEK
jgi:tRNA (Thr-GGU) A37 N-methylase